MKKKSNKISFEEKEDEVFEVWIPIGVMIGTLIGSFVAFSYNNMLFLGCGSAIGLLLGTLIGSIILEKHKKRKINKK